MDKKKVNIKKLHPEDFERGNGESKSRTFGYRNLNPYTLTDEKKLQLFYELESEKTKEELTKFCEFYKVESYELSDFMNEWIEDNKIIIIGTKYTFSEEIKKQWKQFKHTFLFEKVNTNKY